MPLSYPIGHDRRAPRLPQRRGHLRRVAPRHRARRGSRCRRAVAVRVHQRPPQDRARVAPSTRICSTRPTPRCSTTSSSGGSTTRCSTSCPTHRTPIGCALRSAARDHPRSRGAGGAGPARQGAVGHGVPRRCRGRSLQGQPARRGRAVDCVVAGTGYTGEAGVEIAVPNAAAGDLWTAITGAGVTPAGLGARDTLRLEAALPLHGHELGARHHLAAGWARMGRGLVEGRVPWSRGARCRTTRRASAGVLMGIATEGRRPPRADCAVLVDDQPVGRGHQRQLLAGARARHRPGVHAADHRGRHRGGRRRPRHRPAGPVVPTPFVAKH